MRKTYGQRSKSANTISRDEMEHFYSEKYYKLTNEEYVGFKL